MSIHDLKAAEDLVNKLDETVRTAIDHFRSSRDLEHDQLLAYEIAHLAAAVEAARASLDYARKGEVEAMIGFAFIADAAREMASKLAFRTNDYGTDLHLDEELAHFVTTYADPTHLASIAETAGPRHLGDEFELVAETFGRFASDVIAPQADHVHRTNADVPEEIITGLAEMGAFGLSIPESYGGFAEGAGNDYAAMVVATEELSRASLGIGGSLITRPEILARALLRGGTDAQKEKWLPKLASGEIMNAVAVTEPDYGSDVASLTTNAVRVDGGWLLNGVKTWCTFAGRADVLMLLARTDPDRSKAHRGLSLFIVEKPQQPGHAFTLHQAPSPLQPSGGRIEARAIDTLGYRGMHSFEVAIENWLVPDESLVGGEAGLGKGFYFQMEGFENGRIQTAARAVGVMQAAYEQALAYAQGRKVFGKPVLDYQLTKVKLGKMVAIIQAARQFSYHVADLMGKGEGALEASMVKAYVCRAAEWVTREAMQIHGGMGYAEEYSVSRLFVDARVLSIFEGADETLALKVIAKRLLERS